MCCVDLSYLKVVLFFFFTGTCLPPSFQSLEKNTSEKYTVMKSYSCQKGQCMKNRHVVLHSGIVKGLLFLQHLNASIMQVAQGVASSLRALACVRMRRRRKVRFRLISAGQRRQIILLHTTADLIPWARRFSKEKNTGLKPSSHIVWKKDSKTRLCRETRFFTHLCQDFWGV